MVTCSPGAKAQIKHDNGSRNFVVYSGINIAWWKNIVKGTWRIVTSILAQGYLRTQAQQTRGLRQRPSGAEQIAALSRQNGRNCVTLQNGNAYKNRSRIATKTKLVSD